MNGETEDQSPQNGTEPMETASSSLGGGGGVRGGPRRAATVHGTRFNRSSYQEAVKTDEVRAPKIFGKSGKFCEWDKNFEHSTKFFANF